LLTLTSWLCLAKPAAAEPARIEYRAPTSCPDAAAFSARVRERGGNFDAPSSAGTLFAVTIREESGRFAGAVTLENGAASSAPRDVSAPRCEEVADALAVVVAITLQGKADQPSAAAAPAAGLAAATPAAPPPAPSAAPAPKPEPRKLRTLGQWGDESVKVGAGELGARADIALTLSAGAGLGLLPGTVTPRFDLALARTNFITTPEGDGFILGGVLRVRWTVFAPMRYESGGYRSDFFALKAGIGGCSQLTYDREGLVLLACGEIAAGAADVRTKSPDGAQIQDETQGFGTAAFDFESRYNFGAHFHLGMTLGGELWPAKLTAERADGSELVSTNIGMGYLTVGVGLHF
jgi:hypothetical protein